MALIVSALFQVWRQKKSLVAALLTSWVTTFSSYLQMMRNPSILVSRPQETKSCLKESFNLSKNVLFTALD